MEGQTVVNTNESTNKRLLIIIAWTGTLLASALPEIIWREVFSGDASQTMWARLIFILLFLAISITLKSLRPLSRYFGILLVIHIVAGFISPWIGQSPFWQAWFGSEQTSWIISNLGLQLLRLLVPIAVIITLTLMRMKRKDYFLVKGKLNATVEPVPWLGIKQKSNWMSFGRTLAYIISFITLMFSILGNPSIIYKFLPALPLLPSVLFFAALNSFNEELPYRAALLAPLEPAVGKGQAIFLTAALFGIGHFYGVPTGIIGVFMAFVFAGLMGKSMLETRGFFWAWFIHFAQDVIIFYFFAMGAGI